MAQKIQLTTSKENQAIRLRGCKFFDNVQDEHIFRTPQPLPANKKVNLNKIFLTIRKNQFAFCRQMWGK